MSRIVIIAVAVALVSGATACQHADDLTSPQAIARDLRGTWYVPYGIPGSSTQFTLAVSDTTISGTGTFSIEAGQSGTLAVTGALAASVVKLDIVSSIGQTQHFVGQLTARDVLTGSFWTESSFASDPIVITFYRASP